MVTEVAYVLQYQGKDGDDRWYDGGGPWTAIDEAEACRRLAWTREAPQHNLLPRKWQLVKRTTTEEVITHTRSGPCPACDAPLCVFDER